MSGKLIFNRLTDQNHVNNVTNNEVFMIISENHVNTMTSEAFPGCRATLSSGVGVPGGSAYLGGI